MGRRAEGVGIDDAAACGGVPAVDALDELWVGDIQFLRPCAQFQARRLQHGPHAAVEEDGIRLGKQFIRLHRSCPSFYIRTACSARSVRTRQDVLSPDGRSGPAERSRSCGASSGHFRSRRARPGGRCPVPPPPAVAPRWASRRSPARSGPVRYLTCSAAHCRSSASAASAACSASTEPMASDATPAAMSPTPARRICPSTPGPTVTARSRASLHPSRCRKMSSPSKYRPA